MQASSARGTASVAVNVPRIRLVLSPAIHVAEPKKFSYQRNEYARGGNSRRSDAEKESGTTTSVGSIKNAIASADDFNRPLQEFVTEYCWGACWTRPGLPRKTRSMLNLAMLTALNRPHELKMHLKGALTNGVTREEIREILLQTGVYCGVPAAVDAFRTAKEVFAELDKK